MKGSWPPLVATEITPAQFLAVYSTFDKVYLYDNQPERGKQCLVVSLCWNCCDIWQITEGSQQWTASMPAACFLCWNSTFIVLSYSGNTSVQVFVDIFYI